VAKQTRSTQATASGEDAPVPYEELKRRYDDLLANSLAGTYRANEKGRFLECNASMARMLGYADIEELLRIHASRLYVDAEAWDQIVAGLRASGRVTDQEVALRHRSGRPVQARSSLIRYVSTDGSATIEGSLIDVTAYHQAELEHRSLINNYRQLVEHGREGVLIVQNGQVRYANPAAELLLGVWTAGSLVGRSIGSLFPMAAETLVNEVLAGQRPGPAALRPGADPAAPELSVHAVSAYHDGRPSVQLTLHDPGPQQRLAEERLRSRVAEEVNQVLREEIIGHRLTQEELRRSKRFARSLVDSSLDMIIAVGKEGTITEFNPAAMVKFGYEAEEVLGKDSRILYASAQEHDRIQEELDTHGAFSGDVRNVDRNGNGFTSFLAASRLFDEDGKLLGSMGVSRDITHMRRDEMALRASEERYRDLFEHATDLIQSVDLDGRFEYVNTAWRRVLGYTEQELKSLTIWDIITPEEQGHCRRLFDQVFAGGVPEQVRTVFMTKAGRRVIVEGNTNARIVDGRPVATRSIFRDVTSVVEAQATVHQHEAKLRALFESSEHMFWTVDRRVALTSFNRGYANMVERLYGTRPELNIDQRLPRKRFASDAYHHFWEEKYVEAFNGKALRFETDVMDMAGDRVCNEIFLSPVFNAEGQVQEVFGVGHEVTEQKEAEEMVRAQAARLAAIFENSANMMIWTLDHDLRITSSNEHFRTSALRSMGARFEVGDELIGPLLKRAADQRYTAVVSRYRAALDGQPQQFEVELRNRAGRSLWVENFLNPIVVDGRVVEISCLAYGITDKKEGQQKLLESLHEKEVLLKEVHHRVKNNLQIISSILNLQSAYVDKDPRMLELLRDSQDRIRSMSFIHESLYQNKNFSSIDLADYIDGLSRNLMLSYSLSGRVALEKDLHAVELGLDQAIPCGLILNELISNALKHAFPEGGAGTIRIALGAAGSTVRISVSDDGKGLPQGFDEERDANLGLQLVHTLIGQLDGTIEPINGPGVGYLITFEQQLK